MNHKEEMKWLKENDPITYYELNSNPTGTDSGGTLFWEFIVLCVIGVIGFLIYKYIF